MPRPAKKDVVGIKIRLAAELLANLEAAAKKSGRSFNAEAVARLGQSFAEEKAFGGEAGRRLLYFVTTAFVFAGEGYYYAQQLKAPPSSGPKVSVWINDPQTYAAAMMGAIEALILGQPDATVENCMLQLKSLAARIQTRFINKGKIP